MSKRTTCLLCKRELSPIRDGFQRHPEAEDCEVQITDEFGVSIDELPDIEEAVSVDGYSLEFQTFPPVEQCMKEIFAEFGLPRLGGASSGKGWSSFNLFQRCPYAWQRRYIQRSRPFISIEPPAMAIGTIVHALLALMYSRMIGEYEALSPELLRDRLLLQANPELVKEGWRVFSAYRLYYQHETIWPLAIEYDLRDPRTGESCRYDMVGFVPEAQPLGLLPGTYIFEAKTASRFDVETIDGWANDGEILGEVLLWKRLGLDKRFGELKGIIINLLGKQKEPRFHRTIVQPSDWQLESHARDLQRWDGLIQLGRSTGVFPRARGNCIGRYGKCPEFEHCITGEG